MQRDVSLLVSRNVSLGLILEEDLAILHKWRNDTDFLAFCSNRRFLLSFEEFKAEFQKDFENDRHLQMTIKLKSTGDLIGTVYYYGLKGVDGFVFITIFLERTYRRKGYGAEAVALFAKHLFSKFNILKIYLDVYEYNLDSLYIMQKANFSEEGRFLKQRKFGGQRYDVFRFAIYKEDIKRFKKLFSFFQRNKGG